MCVIVEIYENIWMYERLCCFISVSRVILLKVTMFFIWNIKNIYIYIYIFSFSLFCAKWGKQVWFECCCDILSCDHISALCKAATAQPPTMLAKLTRIYETILQIVHWWKITQFFPFETVKFGIQLCAVPLKVLSHILFMDSQLLVWVKAAKSCNKFSYRNLKTCIS